MIWRKLSVVGWIVAGILSLWVLDYSFGLMHKPDTLLMAAGVGILLLLGLVWSWPISWMKQWITKKVTEWTTQT